jgi:NADH dehydrogenase
VNPAPTQTPALHVVTGALGYSGKAIAARLLAQGIPVRTLTNSPNRPNPFGAALEIRPLSFDDPAALAASLHGAEVLINTYWVRFNHKAFTFRQAVANTKALFDAARRAGVRRIVHVSILKPEEGRGLEYYEGKLALEAALHQTSVPHTILRPGVLFGRGDILVNNIAWALRKLPLFGVFGDGSYRLAPLHVDDLAAIASQAAGATGNQIIDCHGPETYTYTELARMIADELGIRRRIVRVPPALGFAVARLLNPILRDVLITRQEIEGLMRGLLWSHSPSRGAIGLRAHVRDHGDTLGRRYASEVGRRIERDKDYRDI